MKRVKEITLPVKLIVKPYDISDLKKIMRLCESIKDKTWQWKVFADPASVLFEDRPCWNFVVIGCKGRSQAEGRIRFIQQSKLNINCEFKVRE